MDTTTLQLYFDGASRGNPGPAGAGAYLLDPTSNKEVAAVQKFLGVKTNNEAEYQALITGLDMCINYIQKRKVKVDHLDIRGDSQLIIRQTRGEYRVNKPHLQQLASKAQGLLQLLHEHVKDISLSYIPRSENKRADLLANAALNTKTTT